MTAGTAECIPVTSDIRVSGSITLRNIAIATAGALSVGEFAGSLWGRLDRNPTVIGGEPSDIIVFGGLGTPCSDEIARDISAVADKPIRGVRYAGSRLTARSIGVAFDKHYDELKGAGIARDEIRTNIIGFSSGTMLALNGAIEHAKKCRRLGLPVHPIDNIIAVASPYSAEDTYMERLVKFIARSRYPGGPVSQQFTEFFSAMHDKGYRLSNVPGATKSSASSFGRGDNNLQWTGKLRLLAKRRIGIPGILEDLVTPDTTFFQLGDLDTDDVTNNQQSRRTAQSMFADQYGCKLVEIDTPGLGHANVEGSIPMIACIIDEIAA